MRMIGGKSHVVLGCLLVALVGCSASAGTSYDDTPDSSDTIDLDAQLRFNGADDALVSAEEPFTMCRLTGFDSLVIAKVQTAPTLTACGDSGFTVHKRYMVRVVSHIGGEVYQDDVEVRDFWGPRTPRVGELFLMSIIESDRGKIVLFPIGIEQGEFNASADDFELFDLPTTPAGLIAEYKETTACTLPADVMVASLSMEASECVAMIEGE